MMVAPIPVANPLVDSYVLIGEFSQ